MIAALVLALAAAVYSGRDNHVNVTPPRVDAPAAAVTVDGILDEAVWQQAARLTNFFFLAAAAFERNRFRLDALFSYQPTPGTVFFAGYSSFLTEPRGLRFDTLQRTNDGFFLKASYLFRL